MLNHLISIAMIKSFTAFEDRNTATCCLFVSKLPPTEPPDREKIKKWPLPLLFLSTESNLEVFHRCLNFLDINDLSVGLDCASSCQYHPKIGSRLPF